MAVKCLFMFVLVGVAVRAQVPNLGFCPDYLPMPDFDMNRFLGKWYESERYFQFSEVASRCVVTDYAKATSGRIYVSNEVTNRLTGVKRVIGGNLELVGKGDEGKLNVKYATTPIATESTLIVLDTDYDSYAVVWSCSGFGPVHAQSAWVMTRDRLPTGAVLQRAYGVLDKFKISRTFFVKTDQEGCAIAASDINAANGITAESTIAEATGSEQKKMPADGKNVGPIVEEIIQKQEEKKLVPEEIPVRIVETKPKPEEKPVQVAEHILKKSEVPKVPEKKVVKTVDSKIGSSNKKEVN